VTLAASDDLVAEAIAAARSTTLLGLSGGALIFVVLLYSYWLSLVTQTVSIGHARLAAIVESSDDAIIGRHSMAW